jgi:UDP-N-acetylmuramoyl-tripeptide--D-alanyl-D-alanine ligase
MLQKFTRGLRRRHILKRAARSRSRSSAKFIGITGSSAKSSTVALLTHILMHDHKTYRQVFNNCIEALRKSLSRLADDTQYCVIEAGVSGIGQMQPMAELLRPDVALITMFQIEHYSAFRNIESIVEEKRLLVEAVPPDGLVLLNADDAFTPLVTEKIRSRIVTFGRGGDADYRARNIRAAYPQRLRFDIDWSGGTIEIETQYVAEQFWLSAVSAFAAAVELGVPPKTAAARIASFQPITNRCGVIEVPEGPSFILDTAKAPYASIQMSIDILNNSPAVHKRFILGTMSDYAGSRGPKYRAVYRMARESFDEVIFIGEHAHRSSATQEEIEDGRFKEFFSIEELSNYLHESAIPGEVIFLKGSQNQHLERLGISWREPVTCWEDKCGRKYSCFQCGRYSIPFEQQKTLMMRWKRRNVPVAFQSGVVNKERR